MGRGRGEQSFSEVVAGETLMCGEFSLSEMALWEQEVGALQGLDEETSVHSILLVKSSEGSPLMLVLQSVFPKSTDTESLCIPWGALLSRSHPFF